MYIVIFFFTIVAIMDMLGNHKCRRLITTQYEASGEKETTENEIMTTRLDIAGVLPAIIIPQILCN